MSIIKIRNKDAINLRVSCDLSIAQEISDYFTFSVPNARYTPLYRARKWDGKIRIYSMLAQELPVGLLDYLRLFAKENGYTIDESDYVPVNDEVTYEEVEAFCRSLKPTAQGVLLEIDDYQIDAVHKALSSGRRLLVSPTGSGKSLIIYCLIRWHQAKGRKQMIVVGTTSLVEQMKSDFADYSTVNGWNVNDVHVIYTGKEKINSNDIVITTWQSVYKLPRSFFEPFHCLYGDEAHEFKAKSLNTLFDKCPNGHVRIGTTGTLDGTKVHKLVLEGMFGSVYKVTTTRKLIDAKRLADLKIFCITLEYTEEERKATKKFTYQEEMGFLIANERRNKFIRNLTLDQKGNTLVLFQYVEKHGKMLYDMLMSRVDSEKRKLFFVFGGTEVADREAIRAITEKENDAIIVASYGTFSRGINIRNLHNVIFASPSKSRIRNLQSLGRGLRVSSTKSNCTLYDISDDLSWKSKQNYTLLHMVERIKIYNEEQHSYSTVRIKL